MSFHEGVANVVSMLKTRRFDDIYIDDDSLCELNGTGEDEDPSPVPSNIAQILRPALFDACFDKHKKTGSPDFAIDFYGMRFRVSCIPSLMGSVYVLRRFTDSVPDIGVLNIEPWIINRIMTPNITGMIVLAGATGSGKTTTISSVVRDIMIKRGGICVTIEDPCEMPLHGKNGKGRCYQVEVVNGDFATPCKSVLRWHPKYIYLGEVRDGVSAIETLRAAINGHLVFCTVHADSPTSAIERLHTMTSQELGSDDAASLLSNGLTAVIHQKMTTVLGKRKVERQFLWLHGPDGVASKSHIKRKAFNMIAAEVQSQHDRFKARG